MNRAERRAAASGRHQGRHCGQELAARALLATQVDAVLDAWSSYVEATLSVDAVVLLIDRGVGRPLEILVATQAAAMRSLARLAPGSVEAAAKLRAPLPDPQVRVVVIAAGGADTFDVPIT